MQKNSPQNPRENSPQKIPGKTKKNFPLKKFFSNEMLIKLKKGDEKYYFHSLEGVSSKLNVSPEVVENALNITRRIGDWKIKKKTKDFMHVAKIDGEYFKSFLDILYKLKIPCESFYLLNQTNNVALDIYGNSHTVEWISPKGKNLIENAKKFNAGNFGFRGLYEIPPIRGRLSVF